jgi:hypothetical protein
MWIGFNWLRMGFSKGAFLSEALGEVKGKNFRISYSEEDPVSSDCFWCYGNVS